MAYTRVIIYDPSTSKKTPVDLPNDIPLRRLIPSLVSRLFLPISQGGNIITYHLDHPRSGRRLADNETLKDAGVSNDDSVNLVPEITAS